MTSEEHLKAIIERIEQVASGFPEQYRSDAMINLIAIAALQQAAQLHHENDHGTATDLVTSAASLLRTASGRQIETSETRQDLLCRVVARLNGHDVPLIDEPPKTDPTPLPEADPAHLFGSPEEIEKARSNYAAIETDPRLGLVFTREIGGCCFDESCESEPTRTLVIFRPSHSENMVIQDLCEHHAKVMQSLVPQPPDVPSIPLPPSPESEVSPAGRLTEQEIDRLLAAHAAAR